MQGFSATIVGTYVTKPDTELGEPERVNVLYPETDHIAISCNNLDAIGGTVAISEARHMVSFVRRASYRRGSFHVLLVL